MSRSGYHDDIDHDWNLIMYRGAVKSAFRGARGQAFLKEMLAALEAMPEKKLIAGELVEEGDVCAIGAVGVKRGVDMTELDPEDAEGVASKFGIATCMAREIVWFNDEGGPYWANKETPEARWQRVRDWVSEAILPDDYVRIIA